jgi:2-oxo-4-hydroxy-4-carboxy--5-ureidoimidazoline (OHCU) decarboxylase
MASTVCYGDSFTFVYVGAVRASQKTHIWASTACYGDSFTFVYVGDVRTSQETHI